MSSRFVTRRAVVTTSYGPLFLFEKTHPARTVLPRHEHAEANFTYIAEGGSDERVQGQDYACGPGSLVYKPGDATHVNRYATTTTRAFVAAWYETRRVEGVSREVRFLDRGRVSDQVRRMYAELLDPDGASSLVCEGLLTEILMEASGLPSPRLLGRRPPPWLARVHERVAGEFRERLSVSALAQEASVHPEHLSRAFRAYFGIHVGEYVRRLRIDWAARALAGSDRPLVHIAQDAGFSDQSHLTRAFRRIVGTTPGAFRRRRHI